MKIDEEKRKEMESSVVAVNKYLLDEVTKMLEQDLLRNMHPIDAEYFQSRRLNLN